jgi:hypothetical protein
MSAEDRYARFAAERAQPPPLMSGDTFYWDGRGAASRSVGRMHVSEPTGCAACLALPPEAGYRASPAVSTRPMCFILPTPVPAIDWAKEASRLTLYLDPELLLAPLHTRLPGTTGDLMWVHGHEECLTPSVHPALLVHTAHTSLQVECAELVLHLSIHDPLHYHIALVLEAAVDAEGEAGQLYAEALADALAVHFLRRYVAAYTRLYPGTSGGEDLPRAARRRGADEPNLFWAHVQAGHRVGAPPVRESVPDRARQAVVGRDRHAAHRNQYPGWMRGPKSLHRALSEVRRYDPQCLPQHHERSISQILHQSSFAWTTRGIEGMLAPRLGRSLLLTMKNLS